MRPSCGIEAMKRKKAKKDRDEKPPQGGHRRRDIIISLCLILVVSFIAFCPSLLNGFTNFDDQLYVTKNRMIRTLTLESVARIFTTFEALYHPLVLLSFTLEYHFFRLNPHAYHATNLVFHLFNCLLVFWLILLFSRNVPIACAAAILFGVHPLRVPSVAWVSERKDLLYSFFYLLSFISYIYYRQRRGSVFYYCSLALFVLSLLSKPLGATLPFLLFLYDLMFSQRFEKQMLLDKIPFLLISMVIVVATFPYQAHSSAQSGFVHNIFMAGYIMFLYLAKILAPLKLSFFHQYPPALREHLPPLLYIFPILAMGLAGGLIAARKYSATLTFGGFFFLITIFPVLQLIPLAGYELIAERFTYIPSIGLIYILSETLFNLYRRLDGKRASLIVIVFALIVAFFSFTTWQRCRLLKDSPTFWNNVLAQNPDVPLAYNNRGFFYEENGDYEKAMADISRALELDPNFADAYINRGLYYYMTGDDDKAISDYTKAVSLKPRMVNTYLDRGSAYLRKGDNEQALADFNRALAMDPDLAEAYNNRGNLYAGIGEHDRAIADYNRALALDPDYGDGYLNRGNYYYRQGDVERALSEFSRALTLDPRLTEAYNNRGNIYSQKGDYARALADFDMALKLAPNNAQAFLNRGNCHYGSGDYKKARADYDRAISLNPELLEAYNNRGSLYSRNGDYAKALEDLNHVLTRNKNYAQSYLTRGNLYFRKGDYGRAVADFTTALQLRPDSTALHGLRAKAYFKMNKFSEAWDDLAVMQREGLEPDPQFLQDLRKSSKRER
jgi:protein O-mannosyl-transferase